MARDLEQDQAKLDTVLALVRQHCPGAIAVSLETSDQSYYGFVLTDIEYEPGTGDRYGPGADLLPPEIDEQVFDLLYGLEWDGVVGESPQGYARVPLNQDDPKEKP